MDVPEKIKNVDDFISQFKKCTQEYRRLQGDTRGTDEDIAHFFNPALKSWVRMYEKQLTALSAMNCERPFMSFIKNFLLRTKTDEHTRR